MHTHNTADMEELERQLAIYKRQVERLKNQLVMNEELKDKHDEYYRASMIEIQHQQTKLDEKNRELELYTEKMSSLNKELEKIALYDDLTHLPNRKHFQIRLKNSIKLAQEKKEKIAVIFVDLDSFKDINDSFGHNIGDIFLHQIANRIKRSLHHNEIMARLGGDEFVLMIENYHSSDHLQEIATRLLKIAHSPVQIEDINLRVSMSMGISRYPEDTTAHSDIDSIGKELMQTADIAMYRSKYNGKNTYFFYEESMKDMVIADFENTQSVKDAMLSEAFFPYFQPIYNQKTQHFSAIEALARWQKIDGSIAEPSDFLTSIKRLQLQGKFDLLIFRRTCKFLHENQEALKHIDYISVNYDASTFSDTNCMNETREILRNYRIPADKIVIELTETSLLEADGAIDNMHRIKALGIRLALDDYGTGYSTLAYLNRLPIDILKIDQYFTIHLENDMFSNTVMSHLISLCRELNLTVCAEGVENSHQFRYLASKKCDLLQGYFFAKPLPPEELLAFLKQQAIDMES